MAWVSLPQLPYKPFYKNSKQILMGSYLVLLQRIYPNFLPHISNEGIRLTSKLSFLSVSEKVEHLSYNGPKFYTVLFPSPV